MKKKLLSVLLCATMVAALFAGCGSKEEEAAAESAAEEAEEPAKEAEEPAEETAEAATEGCPGVDGLNIGICIYKFDDNFMTLYRTELQKYLEAGGATVTVMDGKNDQAEQTNQIQNFITQGVDVLIINLVQSSAAEQVTDQCAAANIPVVFINREPEAAEEERWASEGIAATYVGADARQSGTYQGEIVLATENKGDFNGDGKVSYVMVMGDPENIDAQYRTEFSVKALTDAGIEVEELLLQRGDWDQAKGQQIVQDALTQFGDKVEVYNSRGHVVTRLEIDECVPAGTIHVWFGWRRAHFEEGTYAEMVHQCPNLDSSGAVEDKWWNDWVSSGHIGNSWVEFMATEIGSTNCYWDSVCNIRKYEEA